MSLLRHRGGHLPSYAFPCLILGVALGAAPAPPPGPSPAQANVPSFLAEAARASVADFAYGLAEARIPAGFVAFDEDTERDGMPWHLRAKNSSGQAPLATAVGLFREQYPTYNVEDHDGVLLIRARAFTAAPLSRKTVRRFLLEDVPMTTAFNEAMRMVNPAIPVRGGMVGSLLSDPDDPAPPSLPTALIHVELPDATFLDALNAIVKQVPGTVWVLSRHLTPKGEHYTLSFRMSGGLIWRFDDELR